MTDIQEALARVLEISDEWGKLLGEARKGRDLSGHDPEGDLSGALLGTLERFELTSLSGVNPRFKLRIATVRMGEEVWIAFYGNSVAEAAIKAICAEYTNPESGYALRHVRRVQRAD